MRLPFALDGRDRIREGIDAHAGPTVGCARFDRYQHIVDVGGGDGTLIAGLLVACKSAHGTLYDLPHVVAASAHAIRTAGVEERCKTMGGNFFESVPPGAQAYVLKHVLHDWTDEGALCILRNCRTAMPPSGRLLIIERLLAPPNAGPEGKLSDLNMLTLAGGQERTAEEMGTLLRVAGFALLSSAQMPSSRFVLEASPC